MAASLDSIAGLFVSGPESLQDSVFSSGFSPMMVVGFVLLFRNHVRFKAGGKEGD